VTASTQQIVEEVQPAGHAQGPGSAWVGWLPLLFLPATAIALRDLWPAWVFMWALSFTIFVSLKWLTWWRAPERKAHRGWRSVAYLLVWPGMDADQFLNLNVQVPRPSVMRWFWAVFEAALGAIMLWVVARSLPQSQRLLCGWAGMVGLVLLLHFGIFQVVALMWQAAGVNAKAIMSAPLRATSLAEFWGKRWNLGFRQLGYELIFRPSHRLLGVEVAGLLVFLVSGLIHDLVISVPARGGYGLPTAYFLLQGAGITLEHSQLGKRLGLAHGAAGWLFMAAFVTAPVFWLFHPWFVMRVILPFMHAIRAL